MSSLLNIGSRSLTAAQGALTTVGHNIANANTFGYSRQEAVLATAGGMFTGAGFFGRGVDLVSVRRHYDQFLTTAVRSNAAQAAADGARAGALGELDSVFSEAELGIGAGVDSVFAGASDLANRPGDTTARQSFIARVGQLAQRVTGVGNQLNDLERLAEGRLTHDANQVNTRLTEIRSLNNAIAEAQASGQPPNDLLDQRDVALQALNGLMAVSTVTAPDGTVSLFTSSGAALLVGNQQARLKAMPDPADATRLGLQLNVGPVAQWLDQSALGGGSLAGVLRFRDDDLAGARNQVGRLALVIADRFNSQQALGVDAAGAPGSALFAVASPTVQAHSANTSAAAVTASVADSSLLKASDYRVDWTGSAYTVTRLSDGQASSAAVFPATVDGLTFAASGAAATGDSWLVRPFAAAASGLAARPLAPSQLATGYAATVEAAAANTGAAVATRFQVSRQTADSSLPVSITFNNPPTTFNVTGLASGNLTNVPYTPGQRIPAAPADYNGWTLVLDGAAAAGDSFAVKPTSAPGADNRNALAMGALADLRLVDGATLNESYAALLGDTGARVQSARDASTVSSRLQSEASSRQQNVAGVNLDEEAANLLRYQQAYQASAKIIQASQVLFDALLSAAGR